MKIRSEKFESIGGRFRDLSPIFLIALFLTLASCAQSGDIFADLSTNVASPSAMAVDSTNRRLYLVNSNSEVLYDWQQGSFQVLNITNPQAPTLINTALTKSFSGEVYLDTANNRAFVSNRFSANVSTTSDTMLTINVDESSASFLNVTETSVGLDPFAVSCCDVTDRLFLSTSEGKLQHIDISQASFEAKNIDLKQTLSNGAQITNATITDIVVIGSQAFLSREQGGIYVVNLDEIDDTSVNPVDYFISDVATPRGMATDGTSLFVADEDVVDGTFVSRVLKLDISSLTALTDNTTVTMKDKNDDGLQSVAISVGNDPRNILVSGNTAFVTNREDDTVSVIDLATNSVTKTITVGDEPFSLTLDDNAGTQTLYVGNLADSTLSIIDVATLTAVATYP